MKFRVLLILLVILACQKEKRGTDSILDHFPPNASVFIKINHPDNFKSELKNNDFIEKLGSTSFLSNIREKFKVLDKIRLVEDAVLATYEIGRNNHDILLLQKADSSILTAPEPNNKSVETFTYENHQIIKYTIEELEFYSSTVSDGIYISSSQLLLENAIRSYGKNTAPITLKKLFETSDGVKPASLFFNLGSSSLLGSPLNKEKGVNFNTFADWVSLDFTTNQGELLMNGVAKAGDSTRNFVNLFKKTLPLGDQTASIAPQNAEGILCFLFDDYETFCSNQKNFLDAASMPSDLIENVEEVGVVFVNGKKAVAIHSIDNEGMTQAIDPLKVGTNSYQGGEISQLTKNKLIQELFYPLIQNFESIFYTVFENTYVFSEDENTLQTLIANKRSGFTFEKGGIYTSVKSQIASESSILFITGAKGLDYFSNKHLIPKLAKEIQDLDLDNLALAAQLTIDDEFAHFNLLATKIKRDPVNNSVAPRFTLEMDSDLVMNPQFVKNHRTNKQEIVVQDQDHNLYLISTEGKVIWKKQLEGAIQGKIGQVDLYKNGKLQLAFCTNNQFLILDRNGDEVPPFNKKFEGGNLNPLAVFDYENNRNYRFVVTQGTKIFMYNGKGDIVSGFTYTDTESPIISAPKHFRMGKKDFLLFQLENGQLKIRHRAGGERIKVGRTIAFSENEVFLYKNKFSLTDKKGVLHQVDTKGKLSASNFNLSENHGMFATSKTLVFMDENILSIKGKKVELELGVYSAPKIFYIYDKIYVAVTDLQNQKIYLYDSQAVAIPNFPVYGSSAIDLVDMDNDKKLELVAKDQDNSIIVYGMN